MARQTFHAPSAPLSSLWKALVCLVLLTSWAAAAIETIPAPADSITQGRPAARSGARG